MEAEDGHSSEQSGGGATRDSNLELYRIIVMFLIVSHHYVVNSGVLEKMYKAPLSTNSIFLFLFGAWGKTGINCFMLITGYFMCKSSTTLEKFSKLIVEVLFYNIILSFTFTVAGYGTLVDMFNAIVIVRNINGSNFIACFLVFYLLIPFWNILLENINQKQHQYLIALLGFLYIFLGTVPKFSVTINYVSWFSFLYIIAAYIRFYPIKMRKWGIWTIFFVIIGVISILTCLVLGEKRDKQLAYRFVSDSNTFLAFIIALCSFMFFKGLKVKRSKIINDVGGSTFGVLCIHANSNTMRSWLWQTIFNVKGHYDLAIVHLVIYSLGSIFSVFAICTILDRARKKYFEKYIMDILAKSRIFKKMKICYMKSTGEEFSDN